MNKSFDKNVCFQPAGREAAKPGSVKTFGWLTGCSAGHLGVKRRCCSTWLRSSQASDRNRLRGAAMLDESSACLPQTSEGKGTEIANVITAHGAARAERCSLRERRRKPPPPPRAPCGSKGCKACLQGACEICSGCADQAALRVCDGTFVWSCKALRLQSL